MVTTQIRLPAQPFIPSVHSCYLCCGFLTPAKEMSIVRDAATYIAQSNYWGSVAALLIVRNGFRLLTKRLAVELGTAMSMSGL